ncbi:MAG: efflux RND transporter periplasmic adaptor subunit [Hyphomonadaceae bacterium]
MNKMDLDMQNGAEEIEREKPSRMLLIRRGAVIGAPLLVIAGGVAGFMTLVATGPRPEKNDGPPNPVAVQIATAVARDATITVTAQGETRARVQSILAAQVTGRIVWADPVYIEGGAFRAGQTLVRIDAADYRLAVVRAQSQVAQAQQALQREEAEAELARQDWQALGRGEASPLALREPQLAQARAALAAARAQLQSAQLDLARTNVSAPFAGRIRTRRANIGDFVAPGAPVVEVFSTDVAEVRVPLTDADLQSLNARLGFAGGADAPAAHLSAPVGGRLQTWEGRLTRIEATIDPQTRLTYGIIEVRDPFGATNAVPLAPGIFVTARIDGARGERLIAAPRSALKRNEYVYVVNRDNTIDIRQVRAAQTTSDEVMFREGLRAGERVVVSTLPSPREGMPVTPIVRAAQQQQQQQPAQPQQPAAQQEPLDIRR